MSDKTTSKEQSWNLFGCPSFHQHGVTTQNFTEEKKMSYFLLVNVITETVLQSSALIKQQLLNWVMSAVLSPVLHS